MKKIILLLTCGLAFCTGTAQTLPKWANQAKKAVFSVITYNKDNKILNTGNGFYIDEEGTAVSDYSLFKGADHAVIVTADGKELPVRYIMGANDLYDVIKFKTGVNKKSATLDPAVQGGKTGEQIYLLPYSTQKSVEGQTGTITKVDTISNESLYYTLNMKTTEKTVSCPIMNAEGQVIGMLQKNTEADSPESYAIGISFVKGLSISALSGSDMALNSIGIKKGLPEDESQALVYLYISSSQLNGEDYLELLNDFISRYPNNMEGYLRRASFYLSQEGRGADAEKDLKEMFNVATKKEEAHYNAAKLLYDYNLSLGEKQPYSDWNFDKALKEINEAVALAPEGLYLQLQGDIYFAMKKYPEAVTSYEAVNTTNMESASSFYSEAKAKELAKADIKEIIALMDSAVSKFNEPYGKDAVPYLYERARFRSEAGMHREAVKDYNDIYDAVLGQVGAEFYLTRIHAEMQCRMYQQAINDINKAVELEPQNVEYWLEKGGIHLRVNQLDEAVTALQKVLNLDPKNAGAYRMLGYTQIQQKKNKEGMANLEKAKELGDKVAEDLLQKYSKK